MNLLTILLSICIFGALIFIHELGHFLVARLFHVTVLEFSIGMGPKLWSHVSKKSGIRYSIRIFPLGGYVSMEGEAGMETVQGSSSKSSDGKDDFLINQLSNSEENTESTEKSPKDEPINDPHAYSNQSVWKRILISIAGPFMNVFLGFVLMFVMVLAAGENAVATTEIAGFYVTYSAETPYEGLQKGDYLYSFDSEEGARILSLEQVLEALEKDEDGKLTLVVMRLNADGSEVETVTLPDVLLTESILRDSFQASLTSTTGTPTALQCHDVITKVNNVSVHTYNELAYEIINQGYEAIDFTVKRNGETVVLKDVLVPQYVESGVLFGDLDFIVYREADFSIGTILKHTWYRSLSTIKMVYDSLIGLTSGRYGLEAVSGPVGITKTISEAAETGSINVLYIVTVISINLGIMNLLPLPALDGGHLLLYVIEAVRRKPIKKEIEGIINFVGLVVLLLLAVLVAIKDVISL